MVSPRTACLLLLASLVTTTAHAQHASMAGGGLKGQIQGLFTFGDCGEPLCLNSAVNSASGHGTHFIGDAVQGTDNLLVFLSDAIGVGVSNLPISTATSVVSTSLVEGALTTSTGSAGPIFGERVQTLGRGRFLIGVNITGVEFSSVRGVPLDNLKFTFVHQNVCRTNPDWRPGSNLPCPQPPGTQLGRDTLMGLPLAENDVIEVNTSVRLRLQVASLSLTYGLTKNIEIGAVLPVVRADLSGGSIARVVPFNNPTPHFFGTAYDPSLTAGSNISGTATGIGDIAARVKVNIGGTDRGAFGILAEGRFPTGDEKQFLGSGEYAFRVLGIASAQYGSFAPHLNAGYIYRTGSAITDEVLTTIGFDQLVAPWATAAVDLIGQWQAGTFPVTLPGPVTIDTPYVRQVDRSNIPNQRDNLLDASFGFKFLTGQHLTLITNALVPLNNGGIRGRVAWTVGGAYIF
jgi:hypothetical protein